VKIQQILQKNGILVDLKASDKSEALTQIAGYLVSLYDLKPAQEIVDKILERESEMSTGIGFGIAIPHARISGIDRLYMVAARIVGGIEFNSIDEQPVFLIFMMISPAGTSADHTRILSSLSRIMSYEEIRRRLMDADSGEAFLDVVAKGEDKYVQ
jgi:mannitol/fructose-specific phosphotransferase system IIA component (Ntr-type)